MRVRSRTVSREGRAFWKQVSPLSLDPRERNAIERLEATRRQLESDPRIIHRKDFGVGPGRASRLPVGSVTVSQLARKASVPRAWGRLLFKVARVAQSKSVIELGSCVGVSAAYLQSAIDLNGVGTGVTIEGDPDLCAVARETLGAVSSRPLSVVEGRFSDVLPSIIENHGPFDLVFIDGHHDPSAVEAYLELITPRLAGGAVVILDDVQPLTGRVRPAWKTLVRTTPISWNIDLIRMGIFRIPGAQ